MPFVEFIEVDEVSGEKTRSGPIAINPLHVMLVYPSGNGISLVTNITNGEAPGSMRIVVKGTFDEVLQKLHHAEIVNADCRVDRGGV